MSDFLEKTLEDIIYQNRRFISGRGFPEHEEHMIRQLRLRCGMILDLFSYELKNGDEINCTIFELKKETLTPSTLIQIANYSYEISALLQPFFHKIKINRVVVGNDFDQHFCVLYELMPNVDAYIYKYLVDGILFNRLPKSCDSQSDLFLNDASGSGAYLLNMLLEKGGYLKDDIIETKIPIEEYFKNISNI